MGNDGGAESTAAPLGAAGADERGLRERIIATCLRMNAQGINQGKSGNVSARLDEERFLITPSGVEYEALNPDDVVLMGMDGSARGRLAPSTEWAMHRDVLRARRDVGAIVHAHPVKSTALACHGVSIPAFHYMVAAAGGVDIRCAPYATFGTPELARYAVKALEGREACLLGHHGILALGATPEAALALAVEVEVLASMYCQALAIGDPPILPEDEMRRVLEAFRHYGKPKPVD